MTRRLRLSAHFWCMAMLWLARPGTVSAFDTVVIDPGHGGYNTGQGSAGVYEKWLTLDVSFRLERYLKSHGVKTILTRRNDAFVGLEDRDQVAARAGKDSIFVSVHFNGSSNSSANGLETYYYSRPGYELAAYIHRRIVPALKGANRGLKFGSYHVIRRAPVAAALVEGGFVTNPAERARMCTGPYRQALAEAIGLGILDYKKASR